MIVNWTLSLTHLITLTGGICSKFWGLFIHTRTWEHSIMEFCWIIFLTLCFEVPFFVLYFPGNRKMNASWSFMWQVVLVALLEKDGICCQRYSCERSYFTKSASCCTWYSCVMTCLWHVTQNSHAGQHMGESETWGTPILITSNPSLSYVELQSGTNSGIVSGSLTFLRYFYMSQELKMRCYLSPNGDYEGLPRHQWRALSSTRYQGQWLAQILTIVYSRSLVRILWSVALYP